MKKIYLMDVGARGGVKWPWTKLQKNEVSMVLVEPDPEEAEQLKKEMLNSKTEVEVLPIALWSSQDQLKLNLTYSPGASSVFTPNSEFLSQFPDLERFEIVKELKFPANTVDQLASEGKIAKVDFLKIDVQGAELAILTGGLDFFKSNLIGLEVEVEFSELYVGQPLFADLDTFIRKHLHLELWDISKSYWKYKRGLNQGGATKGRLIFGDALYLRPLNTLEKWLMLMNKELASDKLIALVNCALLYGYVDYASAILSEDWIKKYLDEERKKDLLKLVKKESKVFHFSFKGSGKIYFVLLSLTNLFRPTFKGWASRGERELGSVRWNGFWI